jgi:hypothetical protein
MLELNPAVPSAADSPAIQGLSVLGNYVVGVMGTAPHLQIWTTDGQHKLADNLGGHLDNLSETQIGMTPQQDLLVFEPKMPQVLRFHIHFDKIP